MKLNQICKESAAGGATGATDIASIVESDDSIKTKIAELFKDKKNVKVGNMSVRRHKNHNGTKVYHMYQVKWDGGKAGFMDYAYHEEGSTLVKRGLPPKYGGDRVSYD